MRQNRPRDKARSSVQAVHGVEKRQGQGTPQSPLGQGGEAKSHCQGFDPLPRRVPCTPMHAPSRRARSRAAVARRRADPGPEDDGRWCAFSAIAAPRGSSSTHPATTKRLIKIHASIGRFEDAPCLCFATVSLERRRRCRGRRGSAHRSRSRPTNREPDCVRTPSSCSPLSSAKRIAHGNV
jgi:hypothetical protein